MVIVGGEFAVLTVSKNVLDFVNALSFTVRVMVAVPVFVAAGVRVTVRLAPLPPSTIPVVGMRAVFDDALVTVSAETEESMSPTVKGMA